MGKTKNIFGLIKSVRAAFKLEAVVFSTDIFQSSLEEGELVGALARLEGHRGALWRRVALEAAPAFGPNRQYFLLQIQPWQGKTRLPARCRRTCRKWHSLRNPDRERYAAETP